MNCGSYKLELKKIVNLQIMFTRSHSSDHQQYLISKVNIPFNFTSKGNVKTCKDALKLQWIGTSHINFTWKQIECKYIYLSVSQKTKWDLHFLGLEDITSEVLFLESDLLCFDGILGSPSNLENGNTVTCNINTTMFIILLKFQSLYIYSHAISLSLKWLTRNSLELHVSYESPFSLMFSLFGQNSFLYNSTYFTKY